MGNDFSFWVGNQGLEFTSMGRIWQVLLFVGLLFWVTLLGRGLLPALKKPSESRGLIAMVFLAALCIGGFYASSVAWAPCTIFISRARRPRSLPSARCSRRWKWCRWR